MARLALIICVGLVLAACLGETAPTPTPAVPTNPAETVKASDEGCIPDELVGTFSRDLTVDNTAESDLLGAWTLTIGACDYRLVVDGIEQGGGRLELVEGSAEAGRLSMSVDLGCPNEFMGEAFYDFNFDGSALSLEEAIAGTDLCEGRAAAISGSPGWAR